MAKKILIIDDEPDMRIYLETLFRTAGYETLDAANGIEGVELASTANPDLITLDIMMPKRSGVKAYSELRTGPQTRGIPVIVLTGLSRQDDFFGDDLGDLKRPEAIVEKPIDREAFLAKVEEILAR
jgi:twitching motility two-component system response regulator PilH